MSGSPGNFGDYFEIDEQTGIVKQIRVVDSSITARQFDMIVKAEEISDAQRFTTAKLLINVKAVDAFPPVISTTSSEGFVDENSPVGTKVLDIAGNPILFKTTDADYSDGDLQPMYTYEITTPYFAVSKDGVLLVNEENLDRDPPSPGKFRFQIVAREIRGNAASTPLSVTVSLKDLNDNAPKLPMITPVSITAGNSKRIITKVTATDNDMENNAVIGYSIYHVSNNGASKFTINEKTGEIETRGKIAAGEHYSITVQATDIGNLYSQAILEVSVIPGPNTKPPKWDNKLTRNIFSSIIFFSFSFAYRFVKSVYEVQVSEGAEINSTVAVLKAEDPESDPVKYTLISGNDLRQFSVGQENGVISVIRKLDRETLTRYQLIVRAEDNGGLASSATVNIKITDINDANPEFDESMLPFVFSVDEGKSDFAVGIVHATDADEGVNSEITYSIPTDVPFSINSNSGEIQTKSKLDYETIKEYKFVVTAKDGAASSRLGTATVTVKVQDAEDEVPTFFETQIEVKVPENVPDLVIATARAIDPDTNSQITYVFKNLVSDLFKINSKTGEIKTVRGLDFEKNQTHEIIVGTAENAGKDKGDTLLIKVLVEDRNDVPPVFTSIPEPVTIKDDQPIGALVASMPATDGDGSAPGNVIRYEMVGRGKALKYFQVDPDTGEVRLRDELSKEEDTEYQVDVRAFDLGEPQLSSVASLPVYVSHVLTDPTINFSDNSKMSSGAIVNPEALGLAFSDDSYSTSIPESTGVNTDIKLIQIVNSKKAVKNKGGFKCEIISGNELNLFETSIEDHSCGIRLMKALDFENVTAHELGLKLVSSKYFVNPQKSFAVVKIIVMDKNDHMPLFKFPKTSTNVSKNDTFYGVVNADADIDTTVLQVKAYDQDTGTYGMIKFRIFDDESNVISNDDLPSTYFSISEDTGVLKTQKSLQNVHERPLKFFIEARDNNGNENGLIHKTRARIVVNLISDVNRMTLVFSDSTPKDVRRHVRALEELLLEKSDGLMPTIEKFSNRKIIAENGSVMELPGATDVWFYVIDPQNELIMERNSSEIYTKLLEPKALSQINFAASGIARATAQGIFAPVQVKQQIHKIKAAVIINEDVFPFALIGVSIIILILGTIGIIYICISWSKYKNFKHRMRQYSAPASPIRYDPVIIGSQNGDAQCSMKEYETQVLAMAVNADDEMQLDFSAKNHAFNLDNVSYITHKENGRLAVL